MLEIFEIFLVFQWSAYEFHLFFLFLVLYSNDQCLPDHMTQEVLPTSFWITCLWNLFSRTPALDSKTSSHRCHLNILHIHCTSSSFLFPKDSLQKSPSFLRHLFYLLFFIHNAQFSLFLIIPSKSGSRSIHFCFSETKIPTVIKQVDGSRFYPISVYFESKERLSHFWKITGTSMNDSNLV